MKELSGPDELMSIMTNAGIDLKAPFTLDLYKEMIDILT
jgi:hypothetical protein